MGLERRTRLWRAPLLFFTHRAPGSPRRRAERTGGPPRLTDNAAVDPLPSPPREGRRLPKDQGAFHCFGTLPVGRNPAGHVSVARDCSLTRALGIGPSSRRPSRFRDCLGHCSEGSRLCIRLVRCLVLTGQAPRGGSVDRASGANPLLPRVHVVGHDLPQRPKQLLRSNLLAG